MAVGAPPTGGRSRTATIQVSFHSVTLKIGLRCRLEILRICERVRNTVPAVGGAVGVQDVDACVVVVVVVMIIV